MPTAEVGLADAIRALRSELNAAIEEGRGEALRFELGRVEMEFALELSRDRSVEGGINVWVVSAGAKGSVASATSHRITLELAPKVAGRPPEIADTEPSG